MVERIEVLGAGDGDGFTSWNPEVGEETRRVIEEAPEESQATIQREALETLSKCVSPERESGARTGIVVGHIQSGKTLAYTTLCALAHDNGYKLVIVLPGMTTNLLDQTSRRLGENLSQGPLYGNWKIYSTGGNGLPGNAEMNISNTIDQWGEDEDDSDTVLITVMKNISHLEQVTDLLSNLSLEGVPTLVIDDEADQASLNTEAGGHGDEESSIHSSVKEIRSYLPHHTFLQYTATPQAPLLISLIDQLSPNFAQLLTPGDTYVGGDTFFDDYSDQLVRRIPYHETPDSDNVRQEPPESLLDALKNFFVGATASYVVRRPETPEYRSMMIHPDRLTEMHDRYLGWVRHIIDRWTRTLNGELGPEAREDLIEGMREEYNELVESAEGIEEFEEGDIIPNFDQIVESLPRVLRGANIQPINQHSDGVEWDRHFAHVLVGGEKLGRGFTVRGLTVAYMPRGRGVGNADTIQQRARWFGYKSSYLGFCRVFLTGDMIDAYENYVEHEHSIRQELQQVIESGSSLEDWRRKFLLDSGLRATRRSVLSEGYLQHEFSSSWFNPRAPLSQPVDYHRALVEDFYQQYEFSQDQGHEDRQPGMIHEVTEEIPLKDVFDEFLSELSYSDPRDTERYLGLLLQLRTFIEEEENEPLCRVYKIAGGQTRDRSLNRHQQIKQLYQGAHPDAQGEIYPGDRQIRSEDQVTIQVHSLDLYSGRVDGEPLEEEVPVVAVWVPEAAGRSFIVQ